jgi:hypothetical protein
MRRLPGLRRQWTIGGLMILVAVLALPIAGYRRVERTRELRLAEAKLRELREAAEDAAVNKLITDAQEKANRENALKTAEVAEIERREAAAGYPVLSPDEVRAIVEKAKREHRERQARRTEPDGIFHHLGTSPKTP